MKVYKIRQKRSKDFKKKTFEFYNYLRGMYGFTHDEAEATICKLHHWNPYTNKYVLDEIWEAMKQEGRK